MLFNSMHFLVFFPIVIAIYFIIPKKVRPFWLLISSYYFYMSWNAKYAVIIAATTIATYLCGLVLDKFPGEKAIKIRKLSVGVCIAFNLAILAFFKYGNFAIDSVNSILKACHISTVDAHINYLLPVGISFYTFQALGYIIDVYRGDIKAEKNFFTYALFVSFFPQLVAGPIERSKNLLSQLKAVSEIKLFDLKRIFSGIILMVWGLFMKMVIADRVAILVDNVYSDFRMLGSTELILAAVGFSLQIYCDFGSYSLIAIGAAKVMGFELMENFNTPYFAKDIKDFWGRWHISLSTWFKDYLYIPMGGNRKGKLRKAINVLVVFLVSGLWHGANWSFVLWGFLHGAAQVLLDVLKKPANYVISKLKVDTKCFSWRLLQTSLTFIFVAFAWIFFRSASVTDGFVYVSRIFTKANPWQFLNGSIYGLGLDPTEISILVFSVLILFATSIIKYRKNMTLDVYLYSQNLWFRWFVVIGLIVMIFVFGEYGPGFDAKQFIYFQF